MRLRYSQKWALLIYKYRTDQSLKTSLLLMLLASMCSCGSSSGSIYSEETSSSTNIANTFDVSVSWTAPTERQNGEALFEYELSGYEIAYKSAADNEIIVSLDGGDVTSFLFEDLLSEVYEFRIAAVDVNNLKSGYSDPFLVDLSALQN